MNPGIGKYLANSTSAQQLGGLAALLAGVGAATNNGSNMTQQYHPNPGPMFANTGPGGTSQNASTAPNMYGNFTTTPRVQSHPTIANYATYGQGPTASFYKPGAVAPAAAPPAATPASAPTNTPSVAQLIAALGASRPGAQQIGARAHVAAAAPTTGARKKEGNVCTAPRHGVHGTPT